MKLSKVHIILLFIFLASFIFQLFFALQVPFYSSDDAYFNLRHSKYISENYTPLIYDPLSYGGNYILDTHVYHYFLGLFDIISPDFIYKILPCLLSSLIIFIVFFLSKEITNDDNASLFAASLSAFIPTFLTATLNQISVISVSIPLFFLVVYLFLKIKSKQSLFLYLSVILILLDPLNLLLLFTLLIFGLLMLSQSLQIKSEEYEALGLVATFLILVNLILYKSVYLEMGLSAIWENIPLEIYGNIFQNFNLLETITLVGFIPLILGIIGIILYKQKNTAITFLSSILLADFALLLMRLIPFKEGLIFLSIILGILSSITFMHFRKYLSITKLFSYEKVLITLLVLISIASLLIPSIYASSSVINDNVQQQEIDALQWLKFNTPRESVIAGNVYEGNLIISISDRANIIDNQFINAEDRITDINLLFITESLVKAKKVLDKYGVEYIYFSQKSKELYNTETLVYTIDETCFKEVYKNEFATIYQVVC
ncbi:hypothetical protein J4467_03265 [Candidatus Woesearchaeota archaeon]|nr:hypothetical protein [Candidatus Woesearchaeota archaeon]